MCIHLHKQDRKNHINNSKKPQFAKVYIFQTLCKHFYSGYINQSLEVDEYFPLLEVNIYEYRSDIFDDDEEEDELKFSESDDGIELDEDDVYLDDDNEKVNIAVDVEEHGLLMRLDNGKITHTESIFAQARNSMVTTGLSAVGASH